MSDVVKALFGMVAGPVLLITGVLLIQFVLRTIGVDPGPVLAIIIALTPIWLPLVLFYLAREQWIKYVRTAFAIKNGRATLRIRLPQEVTKSPEAMERVISQIYNPNGADNPWQGWVDGKHPLIYSFELVSIGGEIRFYVNVPQQKTRNAIEAQLYAQYPGIEIVEEKIDYTAEIPWDPERYEYMSFHLCKKEDQEFPIRTYVDCGLDKLPKEEEKVEPMAPMLEQLSMAQPHERVWIQILARPHAKKGFKNGELKETSTWESKVKAKIDAMLGRDAGTKLGPGEFEEQPRLTTGEKDIIAAMERNAGKYAYETAIRWVYITEAGKFNGDFVGPMLRAFSEFDIIGRNGLGPRWRTDFDYNLFSDPRGTKKRTLKEKELKAFKLRSYSNEYDADKPKVMTAEELATIFHIPGKAIVTPGVDRIPSTRSEAPANLPTGR
jgi:hypothetical protein